MKSMHNFVRWCAAALVIFTGGVCAAQSPEPSVKSAAGQRYDALLEQERRVSDSAASTAEDFRVVINRYWSFVRRYPSSGFADNAVWQAANLSAGAFQRFSQERDKYRAVQLFEWLRDQYPHSPLQAKALAQIEQLDTTAAAATLTATAPGSESTVRAVHRQVMTDVVRVTVELDREVPFYQERLEGPARLFFDLKGTRTVASLADATFRYDSDIIRHIRLGRHPNSTTRVVLDLENVGRYSVFTLYNPYRIVIDAERVGGSPALPTLSARQVADGETAGTHPPPATDRASIAPTKPPPAKATIPVKPAPTVPPPAPAVLSGSRSITLPPAVSASALPSQIGTAGKTADKTTDQPMPAVISGKPLSPSANSSGKFSVARQLGLGVSRIVIDAGHGGHDPGASAFGISEAELVLDVSLRLEKLLQEQPGIEVVLTRRSNEYISLDERTEIANRESADLFLSVHANASANGLARGVETYFLNFALNPQAEAVAARENAASGKTMSSLPTIIKAITLNSKLNESRDFAASVQRSLVRGMRAGNASVKDLGVKQAPFMVLIGAAMPSVLAEISFVTNAQEARLLKLPNYRQRIAEGLLAGILRYQQSLKKTQTAELK